MQMTLYVEQRGVRALRAESCRGGTVTSRARLPSQQCSRCYTRRHDNKPTVVLRRLIIQHKDGLRSQFKGGPRFLNGKKYLGALSQHPRLGSVPNLPGALSQTTCGCTTPPLSTVQLIIHDFKCYVSLSC